MAGATTRRTLYDGSAALLDFDGSGNQTARYLQGPAVDEVLARQTSGGMVAWYLPDRVGTIRDLIDNSGAIIDHIDYGVYGQILGETAPAAGDRWKFTGREFDAETGLYQYRARYYDATAGRFLSQDPAGLGGGDPNFYRYVGNDPIDATDPSGLFFFIPIYNLLPLTTEGGDFSSGFANGFTGGNFRGGNVTSNFYGAGQYAGSFTSNLGAVLGVYEGGKLIAGILGGGGSGGGGGGSLSGGLLALARTPVGGLALGGALFAGGAIALGILGSKVGQSYVCALSLNGEGDVAPNGGSAAPEGNPGAPRPEVKSPPGSNPRVTNELPPGQGRTPEENAAARKYYENHQDKAKQWWEERAGEAWPADATHGHHPRALANGGGPLYVEPGFGKSTSDHTINEFREWGRQGGKIGGNGRPKQR